MNLCSNAGSFLIKSNVTNISSELSDVEAYRTDLVDVGNTFLSLAALELYNELNTVFNTSNITVFTQVSNVFLEMLDDLDALLGSNEHFLLGRYSWECNIIILRWIGDARKWGNTYLEQNYYEMNARAQVTLWGLLVIKVI